MAWTRKLPSGRYQACYRDASGSTRTAGTFRRKGDAQDTGDEEERKIRRGEWTDPALRRTLVADYAKQWLATKGNVRARTRINIEARLDNHILPALGNKP